MQRVGDVECTWVHVEWGTSGRKFKLIYKLSHYVLYVRGVRYIRIMFVFERSKH